METDDTAGCIERRVGGEQTASIKENFFKKSAPFFPDWTTSLGFFDTRIGQSAGGFLF